MPEGAKTVSVAPENGAEDWRAGGFGLYVHWPFCQAKCPYCDFNSHVQARVDQEAWRSALVSEIQRAAALAPGRVLGTLYFGGGTPSLMPPETVAAVIDAARAGWPLSNDIEITLEANPTSVEAARLRAYAGAGVNRVSMGIQALNDADLQRLGRLHSADEALRALDTAREIFGRVSFDLIYARQDQTPGAWRAELARALDLAAGHLSLYQLTIEPGTAFGDRFARGRLPGLPAEDPAAEMYEITQEMTEDAGLPAYEVSNHAAPGQESRHNLVYWRGGDYAGIGPGAHGRLTLDGIRQATTAIRSPAAWLKAAATGETTKFDPVSPENHADEYLMMSLRLTEGMSLPRHAALAGCPLDPARIAAMEEIGMLIRLPEDRIAATPAGRAVLNALIAELAR